MDFVEQSADRGTALNSSSSQGDDDVLDAVPEMQARGTGHYSQQMQFLVNAEDELTKKVQELEASMENIETKKKTALQDLKSLQDTVQRSRSEIQRAETIARESVGKAEELRSELVVLEYQRDQAKRELGDIERNVLLASRDISGHPNRMIRSLDNIPLMVSSPTHSGMAQSPTGFIQTNNIHLNHKTQTASQDSPGLAMAGLQLHSEKETLDPQEQLEQLVEPLSDFSSTTSTNESSILTSPIHAMLDGDNSCETDQEDHSLTPHSLPIQDKTGAEGYLIERDENLSKLEALASENADLRRELEAHQQKVRAAEDNLHKQIQDSSQALSQLQGEIITLKNDVHDKVMKLADAQGTLQERDEVLKSLREKLLETQNSVHMLQKEKEEIISEKTEECQKLEAKREVALVELRGKLLEEKEGALQQMRSQLEKERVEAEAQLAEKLENLKGTLTAEIEEKDAELLDLRSKVKQLEEAKESLGVKMRREAEEQIQKAISVEKEVWQMESERQREAETKALEDRLGGDVRRANQELDKMKPEMEHLKTCLKNLKEENVKLREENLAAGREKVEAVSEAREETRKDIQAQLDKMREDMSQDKMRETEKLKEKLKSQEEVIGKLRSEVKSHQQREKESLLSASVEKNDRSLVQDINEECKKTANLLGITPRKVPLFVNLKSANSTKSPPSPEEETGTSSLASMGASYLPTRTQLHTAMANLKTTNEELRKFAQKLKEDEKQQQKEALKERKVKDCEIEKLQSSMSQKKEETRANMEEIREEHKNEVDKLKKTLQKMKSQEKSLQKQLVQKDEDLKEVQKNMRTWKEETALKMARKFEEELNRELEQRMVNLSLQENGDFSHSPGPRSMSGHGSQDANTVKVLKHLQEKVKQLREENIQLKRGRRNDEMGEDNNSSGSGGGQYSNKDQQIYKLEQKIKVLERQLSVAEERCRENATLLSQNSLETSKLETALTQQTKELMKMERAYERLSRSGSPLGK